MSIEDLEIHQPTDVHVSKQYLPLQVSLAEGLDGFLQKSKGIPRSGSLPYLLDVLSHHNEEDETAETNTDPPNNKEPEKGEV